MFLLPPELWQEIFSEAALLPSDAFNSDPPDMFARGPVGNLTFIHSRQLIRQTLRTRLTIVFVCKAWYVLGEESLYSAVVFLGLKNVQLFCRGVEGSVTGKAGLAALTPRKSWWTRRIDVSFSELWAHGRSERNVDGMWVEALTRLLELCPNLEIFSGSRLTPATQVMYTLAASSGKTRMLKALRWLIGSGTEKKDKYNSARERFAKSAGVRRVHTAVDNLFIGLDRGARSIMDAGESLSPKDGASTSAAQLQSINSHALHRLSLSSSFSCPSLRHLRLDHDPDHDNDLPSGSRITAASFIGSHGSSITSLDIVCVRWRRVALSPPLLRALRKMEQLQDVAVLVPAETPLEMLVEHLPLSVRRVAVKHDTNACPCHNRRSLRAVCPGRKAVEALIALPRLKEVRLMGSARWVGWIESDQEWGSVILGLKQNGVAVSRRILDCRDDYW